MRDRGIHCGNFIACAIVGSIVETSSHARSWDPLWKLNSMRMVRCIVEGNVKDQRNCQVSVLLTSLENYTANVTIASRCVHKHEAALTWTR